MRGCVKIDTSSFLSKQLTLSERTVDCAKETVDCFLKIVDCFDENDCPFYGQSKF